MILISLWLCLYCVNDNILHYVHCPYCIIWMIEWETNLDDKYGYYQPMIWLEEYSINFFHSLIVNKVSHKVREHLYWPSLIGNQYLQCTSWHVSYSWNDMYIYVSVTYFWCMEICLWFNRPSRWNCPLSRLVAAAATLCGDAGARSSQWQSSFHIQKQKIWKLEEHCSFIVFR